jgi:hypothetical protein
VERFDAQILALVGDVLLSAGCISYYGPFTGSYREVCVRSLLDQVKGLFIVHRPLLERSLLLSLLQAIVAEWNEECRNKKIPCSKVFTLMDTMGDAVQVPYIMQRTLSVDRHGCTAR